MRESLYKYDWVRLGYAYEEIPRPEGTLYIISGRPLNGDVMISGFSCRDREEAFKFLRQQIVEYYGYKRHALRIILLKRRFTRWACLRFSKLAHIHGKGS